jgi:hypothetical protein
VAAAACVRLCFEAFCGCARGSVCGTNRDVVRVDRDLETAESYETRKKLKFTAVDYFLAWFAVTCVLLLLRRVVLSDETNGSLTGMLANATKSLPIPEASTGALVDWKYEPYEFDIADLVICSTTLMFTSFVALVINTSYA